jgi:hypothetical protein
MRVLLETSLASAMERLAEHIKLVGEEYEFNVDESTFRSLVLAEIKKQRPDVRCQIEWLKFDLLVQAPEEVAVVEFKFYFPARRILPDGTWVGWKGWAGPKNEQEFAACLRKLKTTDLPGIQSRYLVLAYSRISLAPLKNKSFPDSYDDLTKFGISDAVTVHQPAARDATCYLIKVNPSR